MYSIGQFLCAIQTNPWAFAFCASLEPGFVVGKGGKIDERSEQSDGPLLFYPNPPPPPPIRPASLLAILNGEPVHRIVL